MAGVMVPVQVRAQLASGIAQVAPWGIALDGLLASLVWEQIKHDAAADGLVLDRAMEVTDPPDLDLPLARCTIGGQQWWHWAATCAWPVPGSPVDVRMWTGRVDARELEQVAGSLPKVVSDRQGRLRARRMPLLVQSTAEVVWFAVGDPGRIRDLLQPVRSIGKKRATGEGHVLGWQVEQVDVDEFTAGHLHPDGSVGRPCPVVCRQAGAGRVGADGGVGRAGLRPPYMHPGRARDLVLPAGVGR